MHEARCHGEAGVAWQLYLGSKQTLQRQLALYSHLQLPLPVSPLLPLDLALLPRYPGSSPVHQPPVVLNGVGGISMETGLGPLWVGCVPPSRWDCRQAGSGILVQDGQAGLGW